MQKRLINHRPCSQNKVHFSMRKPTVRRSLLPDGILKQTDKKHIGIDQNIEEIVPFQRSPRSILTRALFRKNLPSDEASFKPYSICYPFFDIARYYPLLCAGSYVNVRVRRIDQPQSPICLNGHFIDTPNISADRTNVI